MRLNSNTSTPQSKIQDDETHVPSWIKELQMRDMPAILRMFDEKDPKGLSFSNLDLFSLDGIPQIKIREKIFELLEIKDSKNAQDTGIRKINSIYEESLGYIERVLLRKIPNGFKKKWKDIDEFINAVEHHTKRTSDGLYSLMFCVILKVMIVEAGLYENESIEELDADMFALLKKVGSIEGLTVFKPKKGSQEIFLSYELDGIYSGKLEYRPKSRDSIRTKLIYNRKYPAINDFRDLLAMRFEVDRQGAVHTILKIRNGLYGKGKRVTFEVKGGILTDEDIEVLRHHNIDVLVIKKGSKGGTNLSYEDAKFIGTPIKITNGRGTRSITPEIQFVLPDNKNEAGFSDHKIYDLKKILSANARLFGGLTVGNIAYILKEYKKFTSIDPRSILNHLLYPQSNSNNKPFLYMFRRKSVRTGKEKIYFTTSDVFDRGDEDMKSVYDFPLPLNRQGAATQGKLQETVHSAVESILRAG